MPENPEPIPTSSPDLTAAAVERVLGTRCLSLGPELQGQSVAPGASAGDLVITPPFSIASANCVLYGRAIPRPYFTPIQLPFYRQWFGYRRGDLSVTEQLGDRCLALPFSGVMTESQVERVCDALARALTAQASEYNQHRGEQP
ncbi:MAG TPA: hypothetical protein ENN99_09450 [Chloroflexi bacterium]|nr:hypothetical protein [Chloroflexota bacterium]